MDNPYFNEVAGGVTVGPNRGSWDDKAIEAMNRREELVKQYAWAIPNETAIQKLVEYDPILEVGAGNGYWASLVEQAGGDIAATDTLQDIDGEPEPWTDVEPLSYRPAIKRHGADRTLFMCWPNYDDRWAYNAVREYANRGGRVLIYVGEGRGGCTADEAFHRLLYDDWHLTETVDIPTYLGIHDRMEVWMRHA